MDPKLAKLKKVIDNNREERTRYQRMHEALQDRTREILNAKQVLQMSFWCTDCEADVSTKGTKVIRQHHGKLPIAWWVGFCPVRHKLIRRITDKVNDPYYMKSYVVRRDRSRHKDDLLTPDQARFWMLYGHLHGADHYKNINNLSPDTKPGHTY